MDSLFYTQKKVSLIQNKFFVQGNKIKEINFVRRIPKVSLAGVVLREKS